MIRLPSRIGKRYLEVFHVSQAVVRTHGSIVGRFEGFRCLKRTAWWGDNVCRVKFESGQRGADVEKTLVHTNGL
jgi:hypothetical protein